MSQTDKSEIDDRARARRREFMVALAATGALGAVGVAGGTGHTNNATFGGGPMADQQSHQLIKWYADEFGERPDPGVEGRYFQVDDENDTRDGNIYEDTGDSWELLDVGLGSVSTDQATITQGGQFAYPANRDKISTEPVNRTADPVADSVTVTIDGTDHEYWIPDIPELVAHEFVISIPDGDYSNINMFIPPYVVGDVVGVDNVGAGAREGATQTPRIQGNNTTPTNVKFNSITVVSTRGAIAPVIEGVNILGAEPTADEDVAVAVFGCQDVSLRNFSFAGCAATNGVLAYSSNVMLRGASDLGASDIVDASITKHAGRVKFDTFGGDITGTVTGAFIKVSGGGFGIIEDEMTASADTSFKVGADGFAYDGRTETFLPNHNASVYGSSDQVITADTITKVQFDSALVDAHGAWDGTNYKYVAPVGGQYSAEMQVRFLSPSDTTRLQAFIRKNGATRGVSEDRGSTGGDVTVDVRKTINLNGGDEIDFHVQHDEGADLTIDLSSDVWSYGGIFKI